MLENGAEYTCKDFDELSPLHLAVIYDKPETITALIEHEQSLERNTLASQKDYAGRTPLHFAAHLGRLDCIRRLAGIKYDINCKDDDGCTALHYACKEKQSEVFLFFLFFLLFLPLFLRR